ncbi:MAG: hypothetical protein AB7K04_02050 [Pseudorhodoplanes sp.]
MKKLGILALSAMAAAAVIALSGPAISSQSADCGASFEIRDPQLKAQFAAFDRNRDADLTRVCTVYRADRATRRAGN